jgi:hypothetical protein
MEHASRDRVKKRYPIWRCRRAARFANGCCKAGQLTSPGGGGGGGGFYGGGGGGFYGGGGGGEAAFENSGGGGGGSSYVESSATHVKDLRGAARSGNGKIIISWQLQ